MRSLQSPGPLPEYSLAASNRSARGVAGDMRPLMDLDPPYQRGSVWTPDQRIALVKSWIMGVPVPNLILNDRTWHGWTGARDPDSDITWAVVDGKQRIEAATAWFFGDLAVPASWFRRGSVRAVTATGDGPYVTYAGLTQEAQLHLGHSALLPVIEARLPDMAAEAELYLLVNGGGTAQSLDDMGRAAGAAARPPAV